MRILIVYIIVCLILLSLYSNYLRESLENQQRETDGLLANAKEYNDIMKGKKLTCDCENTSKKKTDTKKTDAKK